MKTRKVPHHCLPTRVLPKMMTEAKTVKNFLVVVMMEQGRGPNSDTHMNMTKCQMMGMMLGQNYYFLRVLKIIF